MKKYLTPCLAIIAVVAIVLCFVFNGQKGGANAKIAELQKAADDAKTALETLKTESDTKIAELQKTADDANAALETLKTESEAKAAELQKAADDAKAELETVKAESEAKAAELQKAADDAKAELETVKAEGEAKVAELQKQLEEAAAGVKDAAAENAETAAEAVTETVDAAKDAAAETADAAAEVVTETVDAAKDAAAETAEAAAEAVTETVDAAKDAAAEAVETVEAAAEVKVMTHEEYIAAENDSEVVIESYVQDHQAWWDNKVTVYLQSPDGAYFAYEMACSEEDAAKLVPGQKIRVKGYKTEWAGEVEIASGCTFEFVDGEPFVAEAEDVTALLATEDLASHMNEFVAVKGATIVAQESGEAFSYKNPEEKNDDLYFAVEVDGATYNFCVEKYLRDESTDVYKAVEGLKVGDVVDIEGFLYWYNGANLQATSLTVK